jgi:23S rRNA pseudouridine1911/1915/1917 synthase
MLDEMENSGNYKGIRPQDRLEQLIPEGQAGQRLDQALSLLFPEFSRSRLQGWIKSGKVQVNGEVKSADDKIWGGEKVVMWPEPEPGTTPDQPEAIPLKVVFEDAGILVVDKPAGMVVHPGNGNPGGTLLNALLYHCPQVSELPRAGIVHRLDKETSGLLVVAKTLKAHADLVRQLQARTVKRDYFALVQGEIDRAGTVDAPLARDPLNRTRRAVHPMGKPAITHYSVLERFPAATLLDCSLETGRTHQIRVHMAHLRHPLVGDKVYGSFRRGRGMHFPRHALHAYR